MAFDIYFTVTDPDTQQATGKLFTFGFVSAVGVQGPQKLVNRWLHCLMTTKGSDPTAIGYGTECSTLIGSNVVSVDDATDALAMYIDDCNEQIQAIDQRVFPPANERLQSAELIQVTILDPNGFQAFVSLKNMAGQTVTLPLPIVGVQR